MTHDKAARCAHCGEECELQTNAERGENCAPCPGAWSLCIYCGGVNRFTEALELRKATTAEAEELKRDSPDAVAAFQAIRWFAARRGLLQ